MQQNFGLVEAYGGIFDGGAETVYVTWMEICRLGDVTDVYVRLKR